MGISVETGLARASQWCEQVGQARLAREDREYSDRGIRAAQSRTGRGMSSWCLPPDTSING